MEDSEVIGFMVNTLEASSDITFVGFVSKPGDMDQLSFYSKLKDGVPEAKIEKVNDESELSNKYETILTMMEKHQTTLEPNMKSKLENKYRWSFSEFKLLFGKVSSQIYRSGNLNGIDLIDKVKILVGDTELDLSDLISKETVDLEHLDSSNKTEVLGLAVKVVNNVMNENKDLKEKLEELTKKVDEKEDMIISLQKELYDQKTREILLVNKLQNTESKLVGLNEPSSMSKEQYSNIVQLLEGIRKTQDQMNPVLEEVKINTISNKINIENTVALMGNRTAAKNTRCKIQAMRDLETSSVSLVLFGTNAVLQNFFNKRGDLKKDIETLKRKRSLVFEITESNGLDNLIALLIDWGGNKNEENPGRNLNETVAIIVLNFAAETGQSLLSDETYVGMFLDQVIRSAKMMADVTTNKCGQVVFVLPPATSKSYKMIRDVGNALEDAFKDAKNVTIVNMIKLQEDYGRDEKGEDIWEKENVKMFGKFSVESGKEGWNSFSTNVMISNIIKMTLGKPESKSCKICGIGHDSEEVCQDEVVSDKVMQDKEEDKMKPEAGNSRSNKPYCSNCTKFHWDACWRKRPFQDESNTRSRGAKRGR